MDLLRVGKARDLLIKSEKAKKALLDAFSQTRVSDSTKDVLLSIEEIASFCERDDTEITLTRGVIQCLLENLKPATDDVILVLDLLNECQRELEGYIVEKMDLFGPKSEKFTEHYTTISEYIKMKEKDPREQRKNLVQQHIFETPGLYVRLLAEILHRKYGEEGFSSSSVLQYINELYLERRIITVGGPQGRERYCFPDPRKITDRTKFYHKVFAIEGVVEKKITMMFTANRPRKFRDLYLANGVITPIILAVDYGKLPHIEKTLIRSYGDLEPFEYFVRTEGFIPQDQRFTMDVLKARKVARVVNGHEEEVWLDKERADLFNYSSTEEAATYHNVPPLNV